MADAELANTPAASAKRATPLPQGTRRTRPARAKALSSGQRPEKRAIINLSLCKSKRNTRWIKVESKRAKMATAVGIKNHGQRLKKRRATAWKTTGNKIYNDGQRNLEQWATQFRATVIRNFVPPKFRKVKQRNLEQRTVWFFWGTTDIVNSWGNGHRNIYTNLICISKTRAYLIYSLSMRIYIYALE